jgi:hypothetical protein
MFRCGFCGGVSKSGETQVRVVTETRQRSYEYNNKEGELEQSIGFEIVRETLGHESCAKQAVEGKETKVTRDNVYQSKIAGNAMRIRRFIARKKEEEESDE